MFHGRCSSVTSSTVYQIICIFCCKLTKYVKGNQKDKLIKCVDLYSDSSVKDVPVRNKYSMVIGILSREITIKLSTHGLSLLSNRVYLPSSHMRCVIFLKFFSMEIRWSLQWSQADESLPRDVIRFYGHQLHQKVHSRRK